MSSILIVSCVFTPEPVVSAQISHDLANKLCNLGNKVTVLAPFPSRPAGFSFEDFTLDKRKSFYEKILPNVQVIHLNSKISPKPNMLGRFQESWSFGRHVANYIKDNKSSFKIVYINSWPIFSQMLVARICRKFNIPYIVHVQDIYPESLTNKLPFLIRRMVNTLLLPLDTYHLKYSQKIIVISEYMMKHLATVRDISFEKFEIVYNWQNEANFVTANKNDINERFTFMYLGNIGPVAGVETVIKAFIQANLKHCNLIIAGSGTNKKDCIALASKQNAINIKFIDVPNGDVATTQSLADVLLLPVISGGANSSIPSKLPAYMFSSKPIIATLDVNTATANAIIAAKCGWVGPAEDIDWLSNQMKLVSEMSSTILKKYGQSGYNYGMANFSKEINLKKVINLILNERNDRD